MWGWTGEEQHDRAWKCVKDYMSSTLRLFPGKTSEAISTVMPDINAWIDETLSDIAEVGDATDHGIIIFVNIPSTGILTVQKNEWILTYVSNTLQKFRRNGLAIIVHPNRAAQVGGTELQNTDALFPKKC